jgi:hypothetical protein
MKKINLNRKCHKCFGYFSLNDTYYTICREPSLKDKVSYNEKVKILFFHPSCFEEIAGQDYLL